MGSLPDAWKPVLYHESTQPYYQALQAFLAAERQAHQVFPPAHDVFAALELTPYPAVRVLLLGQDPYHDTDQAQGLAFSVRPGAGLPPSLRNIFRELHTDLGLPMPNNGDLRPWARQGVLLLNTVLTVRAHAAHSHRNRGWEQFTDAIIRALNARPDPLVFVLWGAPARKKAALIDATRHTLIVSAHPSPLSAHSGFFGSRPFSQVNAALRAAGGPPIDWQLPDQ